MGEILDLNQAALRIKVDHIGVVFMVVYEERALLLLAQRDVHLASTGKRDRRHWHSCRLTLAIAVVIVILYLDLDLISINRLKFLLVKLGGDLWLE